MYLRKHGYVVYLTNGPCEAETSLLGYVHDSHQVLTELETPPREGLKLRDKHRRNFGWKQMFGLRIMNIVMDCEAVRIACLLNASVSACNRLF